MSPIIYLFAGDSLRFIYIKYKGYEIGTTIDHGMHQYMIGGDYFVINKSDANKRFVLVPKLKINQIQILIEPAATLKFSREEMIDRGLLGLVAKESNCELYENLPKVGEFDYLVFIDSLELIGYAKKLKPEISDSDMQKKAIGVCNSISQIAN